jgi:HEAT repeat protein
MMEDIQRLLRTIENGKREEIWEAAKQLESVTTDAVLQLVSLLENAKDAHSRSAAAYVLGFGRYASARTALEQVLDDVDEDADVRGHAAEALAYIQNPRSVGVLLRNVQGDNPGIQYWCTFALGQIGDPAALPVLKQLAEPADDRTYEGHSLRAEALDAMAEIEQGAM